MGIFVPHSGLRNPGIWSGSDCNATVMVADVDLWDSRSRAHWLSRTQAAQPIHLLQAAGEPDPGWCGPALNALGTIMLVMSFVIAIIGYFGYRWMTRGGMGQPCRRSRHPGRLGLTARRPAPG
jgi:hypothetical protein